MPEENPSRLSSSATDLSAHDFDGGYPVQEIDPPNPEAIAAERRRNRRRSIILAVSSVIFMGTIGVITLSGVFVGSPSDKASAPEPAVSFQGFNASRLQKFCIHAEFETACQMAAAEHLAETGATDDDDDDDDDDPHEILLVLVDAAVKSARKALKEAAEISSGAVLGGRSGWAVGDCRELLHFSVLELEACLSEVQSVRLLELQAKAAELMSAFSAAVTYPSTCEDGIATADDAAAESWTDMMTATAGRASEAARNCLAVAAWMAREGSMGGRKVEAEGGMVAWRVAGDKADVVVAKDGSGDCQSIGEGLKLASAGGKERDERFVIYVKEGVYEEDVKVTAEMNYITMYGDGPRTTVVTGSKGFDDEISLYGTATFAVSGFAFMARDMGFQNKAGPTKAQAVALLVQADLSVFYNCWIDGYQNTLIAHTRRQFYRDCTISGTMDVISGDAAAVFQNCLIALKQPPVDHKPSITAQARVDRYETTGFVLQNCTIAASDDLSQERQQKITYLGRPVKEESRTVIMQSEIGDVVRPEGWSLGGGESEWAKSLYFCEFGNRGSGSDVAGRVKWKGYHVMTDATEVTAFTAGEFINGKWWLNLTGAPFYTGLDH